MNKRVQRRKGLTLIEVLLVILIVGMLATVGVRMLVGTRDTAKIDTTQLKIEKAMGQLNVYETTLQQFPSDDQGLAALVTKPEFENEELGKRWSAMLTQEDLNDAWGNALVYRVVEEEDSGRKVPRIYSFGPNGEDESGEGDDIKDKRWAAEAKAE